MNRNGSSNYPWHRQAQGEVDLAEDLKKDWRWHAMTRDHQNWLKLLGAELRKRLTTEELAPAEIELLLGKLREIEGALSKVTFVSDSGKRDEPPDEPSREV